MRTTPSTTVTSTAALRSELAVLRARYDDGAVSPAIYTIIRKLESDIAWCEHTRRTRLAWRT
jgi:hypothetical protein